ncbi:MAG: TetR/AcrR family transcriptional regulator [Burkholderiales bacterium]
MASTRGSPKRRKIPGDASAEPRRARLAPAARERLILDEAIRYFSDVGFGGQTRELSRRLGITQPLLYRYFPSKRALLERVYQEVFLGRWDQDWERLIEDRTIPLRDRLIEFYRRYTKVIFRPEWIRLYMYSGLTGAGFNKRYVARLEKLILQRICIELRHHLGAPSPDQAPISPDELEIVWCMHSGIFYYGIRKFIYRIRVHPDPLHVIALAVDETLEATPSMLRRLLDMKANEARPE